MMWTARGGGLIVVVMVVATGAAGSAARAAAPATRPQSAATQPAKAQPWCDHVSHSPTQPKPGEVVKVSASVEAGMTNVVLLYQVVEPGAYVELKDAEYSKNWQEMPMAPAAAPRGRTTFTAELPGDVQKHRRLIRYRIRATGADGKTVTAPLVPATVATPTSPATPETLVNYAYFVYGGIPAWRAAIEPNSPDPRRARAVTFPAETMARVRPYQLIGKRTSVENATWREQPGGKEYKYTGTLVIDGIVHDHVRFRARGGVWRYALGKNMWKFDLLSGDPEGRIHPRDDFGRPMPGTWEKVNLRCIIQLGDYGRRGEQGMYESVGFRLFNLAGVPACNTAWVQLRIIDDAEESPVNQYEGDFWGLYLAIENEDGRFLKAHGLPDGNLFKMGGGTGELNHHGADQPADRSDLDAFINAYNNAEHDDAWWREHLDLPSYYSYRSILECIHQYDIADGKNYDYYHNPETGKWQVIPWDLDLTWGDHMYGNGDEPFNRRVLTHPAFRIEYQNRLREIRDLLFNPDQAGQLIDEYAAVLLDANGKGPSIAEADRRKWDYHPALAMGGQAGHGRFYQSSPSGDFAGMVRQMKEYVKTRGAWVDQTLLADPKTPATPTATYVGTADHPAAKLRFRPSPYRGATPLAGVQWRIAEVTPASLKQTSPPTPRLYEITPVWQSEEFPKPGEIAIPAEVVKAGHTYRVRVRMKESGGRWSHWSAAVEFVAGA